MKTEEIKNLVSVGSSIRIYEDPYTENKLEGTATVKEIISYPLVDDMIHLKVQFTKHTDGHLLCSDEEPIVFRRVNLKGQNFDELCKVEFTTYTRTDRFLFWQTVQSNDLLKESVFKTEKLYCDFEAVGSASHLQNVTDTLEDLQWQGQGFEFSYKLGVIET